MKAAVLEQMTARMEAPEEGYAQAPVLPLLADTADLVRTLSTVALKAPAVSLTGATTPRLVAAAGSAPQWQSSFVSNLGRTTTSVTPNATLKVTVNG